MGVPREPNTNRELRKLPQVARLLEIVSTDEPHSVAVDAIQEVLGDIRRSIEKGDTAPELEEIILAVQQRILAKKRSRLTPVINATGVLLHTNLGRAPLSEQALKAVSMIASSYSNLEYDLSAGRRGSRYGHSRTLLVNLTGAESALVVNNNAAAVLLCLATFAKGREVIISRGELIEIGGEFRIPDILAESGAVLVEVGTTNRTHVHDYERAISDRTAAIMKVHPSNYRVVGFTAEVSARNLVELAHSRNLLMIHDLGSGLMRSNVAGIEPGWLRGEPTVADAVASKTDVITFSGDKLLGGPQAGIILGSASLIKKLERSPLLRALRVDKTTLAALEATLLMYLQDEERQLPLWQMALAAAEEIEARAEAVISHAKEWDAKVELVEGESATGGGSSPESAIPTMLIEIAPRTTSAEALSTALLGFDPPIVTRIFEDRVVIDLRTVVPSQDELVIRALSENL